MDPRFRLVVDGHEWTFGELRVRGASLASRLDERSRATLDGASTADLVAALITLDGVADRVDLLPAGVVPGELETSSVVTTWVLYSSGSSGDPTPVGHSLESLSRGVRPADGQRTWGLLYDPMRLAGLSVVLQALATGSTLVDARSGSIGDRVATLRAANVTGLSATPTLWRQLLQSGVNGGWPLQRITLGGEVADQLLLDALAARFPDARVTHVFAASETGAAFAVSDGREGFPAAWFDDDEHGLQVRDNLLWVRAPGSTSAGADGYAPTGDVVERQGDRVRFAGRETGMVNVGGTKVYPEQVERMLRTHPQVADAVVTSRRNPFSGQILVGTVSTTIPGQPTTLGSELRAWLSARLPAPMVPAQLTIVDELPSSPTGKVLRS